jgi:hypothetical protein
VTWVGSMLQSVPELMDGGLPAEHGGNRSDSVEEAEVVATLVDRRLLRRRVPGVDIGTVDNFQGHQARSLSTRVRHPVVEFTEQPDRSRPPARAC